MKQPNTIKQRNLYLLQIRQAYQEYLFSQREQAKKEILEDLIDQNTEMLHTLLGQQVSRSFLYKGTMYYGWNCRPHPGANKIIHPALREKIIQALNDEDFDIVMEESRLMGYINNVLSTARNMQDLWELIPSRIQEPLYRVNSTVFNYGDPMTERELEVFRQDNERGLRAFKRLFLTRLLLA